MTNTLYIDHSVRVSPPDTVIRHVQDILDNGISSQKILNGLDFPMWKDSQWDQCSYATDMVAWDYLHGQAHCGSITTQYPTPHMWWGLAGTAHTVSYLHMDSDGFATFVQVMCGMKVWAVYGSPPNISLSTINLFNKDSSFQLDTIPTGANYGLEAIILRPGDTLLVSLLICLYQPHLSTQIDATWCPPLCVWTREYDMPWWPFLFYNFNASYVGWASPHFRS